MENELLLITSIKYMIHAESDFCTEHFRQFITKYLFYLLCLPTDKNNTQD